MLQIARNLGTHVYIWPNWLFFFYLAILTFFDLIDLFDSVNPIDLFNSVNPVDFFNPVDPVNPDDSGQLS